MHLSSISTHPEQMRQVIIYKILRHLKNSEAEPKLKYAANSLKADMSTQYREGTEKLAAEAGTHPPSMYKVLLLNDDYTPMDFVVLILQQFFHKDREQATRIMFEVHTRGHGVCGIFAKDVAATKVEQVLHFSQVHQHPLQCVMEEN